ncbi:MAG: hypothetical protein Q8R53_03305, partial [Nanoarchaeota archaeon]|nr:hypothetical protein [Nanoarchaeota archaeon]
KREMGAYSMNNQTPRSFLPGLVLAVGLSAPALPCAAQTKENNDSSLESICGIEPLLRNDYLTACAAQLQGEAAAHQVEVTRLAALAGRLLAKSFFVYNGR